MFAQLPSSLRVAIRTKMVFRLNYLFILLQLPIRVFVTVLLWDFIVGSSSQFMGLSRNQILLFVSFTAFLQFLYNTQETMIKMEQDLVQGGAVVGFTLPIDYHVKEIFEGWGDFLIYFVTGSVTLAVVISFMGITVELTLAKGLLILVLILLNTVLQYLIVSILAAAAVLVGRIGGFGSSLVGTLMFFGGAMIPLALFPQGVRDVLVLNPMSSMVDFPAMVLVSNGLDVMDIIYRLLVLVGWLLVLSLVNRRIWRVSRDRFSAPGE